MIKNYLKGTAGDSINVMMADAAMNFKRIMNKWTNQLIFCLQNILKMLDYAYRLILNHRLEMTF